MSFIGNPPISSGVYSPHWQVIAGPGFKGAEVVDVDFDNRLLKVRVSVFSEMEFSREDFIDERLGDYYDVVVKHFDVIVPFTAFYDAGNSPKEFIGVPVQENKLSSWSWTEPETDD